MAQLIQMRNRIKAVQTIKKITHAMRLIAMAKHSQLQDHRGFLEGYKQKISSLFIALAHYDTTWKNPLTSPPDTNKHLVIIIGSQKGLCGNFNEMLFKYFEQTYRDNHPHGNYEIIAAGEKAVDYCTREKLHIINEFREFTTQKLGIIAESIASFIMDENQNYSTVTIFHNFPRTFFSQKSQATTLLPMPNQHLDAAETSPHIDFSEYAWEETPTNILNYLIRIYVQSTIEYALFESLMAESAARFISMDSSTRNAKDVLEELELEYNKTRQAKITRELSELMGSF